MMTDSSVITGPTPKKYPLIVQVDSQNGTIQLAYSPSGNVCTMELDELPDKYKKFFAKYLLLN